MQKIQEANLFETVSKRKSIRKFSKNSLPKEKIDELKNFIESIEPIFPNIKTNFEIATKKDTKAIIAFDAPHTIFVYSEKTPEAFINIGFMLQKVNLFLSANEIGCCWFGMAKPSKDFMPSKNGLEFGIALVFGEPAEKIYRENISEFKRKTVEEIASPEVLKNEQWNQILQIARLAPSAVNSQSWFCSFVQNKLVVSKKKLNPIKALIYKKMNLIDIGIFCSCVDVVAKNFNQNPKFTINVEERAALESTLQNHDYMLSIEI